MKSGLKKLINGLETRLHHMAARITRLEAKVGDPDEGKTWTLSSPLGSPALYTDFIKDRYKPDPLAKQPETPAKPETHPWKPGMYHVVKPKDEAGPTEPVSVDISPPKWPTMDEMVQQVTPSLFPPGELIVLHDGYLVRNEKSAIMGDHRRGWKLDGWKPSKGNSRDDWRWSFVTAEADRAAAKAEWEAELQAQRARERERRDAKVAERDAFNRAAEPAESSDDPPQPNKAGDIPPYQPRGPV